MKWVGLKYMNLYFVIIAIIAAYLRKKGNVVFECIL